MLTFKRHAPLWLLLAASCTGCSGLGTSLARIGRLEQNKGYEIPAELPVVQAASQAVLTSRGYQVSVKADPLSGAEGAGQIVIGQRITNYDAVAGGTASGTDAPTQLATRELVDIYLSKKWRMRDDRAAINVTLVNIVGGSYLRKTPSGSEVETKLSPAFIEQLRAAIGRSVSASRAAKPAAP